MIHVRTLVAVGFCLGATLAGSKLSLADNMRISVEKAISVAKETIDAEQICSVEVVFARWLDTPRDDIYGERTDEVANNIRERLKGREYWLVYFRPQKAGKGGDAAVYVDAASGEVLHIYRGR